MPAPRHADCSAPTFIQRPPPGAARVGSRPRAQAVLRVRPARPSATSSAEGGPLGRGLRMRPVNGPGAGDAAQFCARRADIVALEGTSRRSWPRFGTRRGRLNFQCAAALLRHPDPGLATRMGEAARQTVLATYSAESVTHQDEELFGSLIARPDMLGQTRPGDTTRPACSRVAVLDARVGHARQRSRRGRIASDRGEESRPVQDQHHGGLLGDNRGGPRDVA